MPEGPGDGCPSSPAVSACTTGGTHAVRAPAEQETVIQWFAETFGAAPTVVARAPGRLEILGNHTDYNAGLVLSAAVTQSTWCALGPLPGRLCRLRDGRDGTVAEFSLDDLDSPRRGDWCNYIKGVVRELRERGHRLGAFAGAFHSTVPLSAGMSSSAALEMSAGLALDRLFGLGLPREDWARIGQASENKYIGVQSGLLDQFSSLFGQQDSLILCDFRTVKVLRTVKLPPGFVFVVANSRVKHDLVDSDYNVRRQSCERAVAVLQEVHPEVKALRDVSSAMLAAARDRLDLQDCRRARHVVEEIERVEAGVKALDAGDVATFGKLLYASHASSRKNFENSCLELDALVELSTAIPGCCGARLSGGGFGGISIHLVEAALADDFCGRLRAAYEINLGKPCDTIVCGLGPGAECAAV
jgi:galactokinase